MENDKLFTYIENNKNKIVTRPLVEKIAAWYNIPVGNKTIDELKLQITQEINNMINKCHNTEDVITTVEFKDTFPLTIFQYEQQVNGKIITFCFDIFSLISYLQSHPTVPVNPHTNIPFSNDIMNKIDDHIKKLTDIVSEISPDFLKQIKGMFVDKVKDFYKSKTARLQINTGRGREWDFELNLLCIRLAITLTSLMLVFYHYPLIDDGEFSWKKLFHSSMVAHHALAFGSNTINMWLEFKRTKTKYVNSFIQSYQDYFENYDAF